jgi:hypothetical protein
MLRGSSVLTDACETPSMLRLSSTARDSAARRGIATVMGVRALVFVVLSGVASFAQGITDIKFPTPLPAAQVSQPYSFTFAPVDVQGSLTWSIDPAGCLEPNLGIDDGGQLSGTPTVSAVYNCQVTAMDSGNDGNPSRVSKDFTLQVVPPPCIAPTITSGAPPSATVGVRYSFTVTASGDSPLTLSVSGLPPGLAFDPASGIVSGVPTAAGTSTLTITASNQCERAVQTQTLTVVRSASTLSISASPNPAYFSQAVIVIVRAAGGPFPPQGVILLCAREASAFCPPPFDSPPPGTPASSIRALLSAPLDGGGQASFTLTGLTIDNYKLAASYGGDAAHEGATAGPIDEFVIKGVLLAPPKVALAAPLRATLGAPLSIGVRVTPSEPAPMPTGTVRLYAGTTLVGSATLDANGSTQFAIAATATGALSLRADYSGDALFPSAASSERSITIAAGPIDAVVPAVGPIGLALLALALAVLGMRPLHRRVRRR